MKLYFYPQTKTIRIEQKSPILQTSIGIHHEMGYPEDASNSSFFDR